MALLTLGYGWTMEILFNSRPVFKSSADKIYLALIYLVAIAFLVGLMIPVIRRVVFPRAVLKRPFSGLFNRRMIRRYIFCLACLATLLALFYAEENWRGQRAWENYKAELIASGERLNWKDYLPARVPDEENFVRTPFLQAAGFKVNFDTNFDTNVTHRFANAAGFAGKFAGTVYDGEFIGLKACQEFLRKDHSRTLSPLPQEPAADVLTAFKQAEPIMDELRQASLRPHSQFAVSPKPWPDVRVPNFVTCRSIAQAFSLHASAELTLGNSDAAFRDFYTLHQLATGLENSDPILVSMMVGAAIHGLNLHTFWEGWAKDKWSDAQLEKFQKIFASIDLLKNLDNSFREERNGFINTCENVSMAKVFDGMQQRNLFVFMPRGWVYQNLVVYARATQHWNPIIDVGQQRVFPVKCDEVVRYMDKLVSQWKPFRFLASIVVPNFTRVFQTGARTQTTINEAMLVCALERYRHAHGEFPETLDALAPQFIEKIPHDIIGGGPLKYRRIENNKFLLYSIGWNEKDDGGVAASKAKNGQLDFTQADWVWLYPVEK